MAWTPCFAPGPAHPSAHGIGVLDLPWIGVLQGTALVALGFP
jgi:hypothetical protein